MDFMTRVQVEPLPCPVTVHSRMLSLGSCFAQAVGSRLRESRFDICVNPFGTLYNPESIALVLEGAWREPWAQTESFNWVGTDPTAPLPAPPRGRVVTSAELSALPLGGAGRGAVSHLLLTFGTSHVYRLADGHVVCNCHKQPSRMFTEDELSVEQIVARYQELIPRLRKDNPGLKVLFTVSPYRYMKYGLHGSALSKARLLLAVDEICRTVEGCHYFPAYEIVTDELRDYRFYEADMVHPSAQAAEYVWERFCEACLDAESRRFVKEYAPVLRAKSHRPLNPDSAEYQAFATRTAQQEKEILNRYGIHDR